MGLSFILYPAVGQLQHSPASVFAEVRPGLLQRSSFHGVQVAGEAAVIKNSHSLNQDHCINCPDGDVSQLIHKLQEV